MTPPPKVIVFISVYRGIKFQYLDLEEWKRQHEGESAVSTVRMVQTSGLSAAGIL